MSVNTYYLSIEIVGKFRDYYNFFFIYLYCMKNWLRWFIYYRHLYRLVLVNSDEWRVIKKDIYCYSIFSMFVKSASSYAVKITNIFIRTKGII